MPLLYELLYRKDNNMKKVGFIGVYDKTDLILDIQIINKKWKKSFIHRFYKGSKSKIYSS